MERLNERLKSVEASPIRAFNDRIVHIEGLKRYTIGEPDFNTPLFIRQAAVEGIMNQSNGYTHSKGLLSLRQAAHDYLLRHYQVSYDPQEEIIISAGATEGIYSALYTIINPYDKVLLASPHYPGHLIQINLVGGQAVIVDVSDCGLKWTAEKLEETCQAHPEAKAIILNYPSNPTGQTYSKSELESLAQVIEKHNLWVISDELYAQLTYDSEHTSMAALLPGRTVLINGLSKSHAMTGWRIGVVAGPQDFMSQFYIIHQGAINTPSTQSQYAAIAALSVEGDESIKLMKGEYLTRRNYLVEQLSQLGYFVSNPAGAFYLFIKIPDWYQGNDMDFCLDLAHNAKLGVVPGRSFGQAGEGYFRLSYAASQKDLEHFVRTLTDFTNKNK